MIGESNGLIMEDCPRKTVGGDNCAIALDWGTAPDLRI